MGALTESDRERLRQMLEVEWVDALFARDWDASMGLCAPEFVYLPQDHPAVFGDAEARAFLNEFPHPQTCTQTLEELVGDTDLVVARGSFAATFQVDGAEVGGRGKFLAAATKASGEWRFTHAAFNWDAPLAPGEPHAEGEA